MSILKSRIYMPWIFWTSNPAEPQQMAWIVRYFVIKNPESFIMYPADLPVKIIKSSMFRSNLTVLSTLLYQNSPY